MSLLAPPRPTTAAGMRIGLLGGSFNPAHAGHRHISLIALTRLELDEVWWLVSPQNPLKSPDDMDAFEARFASAEAIAAHPRIRVSDLETRIRTRYTADTLDVLTRAFPHVRFVWIMGADNMIQFPRWQAWTQIMETLPVAVIARPGYSLKAQLSKAAQRYGYARLDETDGSALATLAPPAWIFLEDRLSFLSSTALRRARIPGTAKPD